MASPPSSRLDLRHTDRDYQLTSMYNALPADDSTIRLLRLQPKEDSESDIDCTLEAESLSGTLDYEALSYTWGEPLPVRRIFVTSLGRRYSVNIRENLHDCLRRIRKADVPRMLWIDAIRINQENLLKKGLQVKLMPDIYVAATQVLVWLGEAADSSDEFMDYINGP